MGARAVLGRAATLEAGVGARLEERAVAGSALLPVAKYLFGLGGKSLRPRVAAAMAAAANTRAGVSSHRLRPHVVNRGAVALGSRGGEHIKGEQGQGDQGSSKFG